MLHIDGDILVFRCGFAAEKMHYYVTLQQEDGDEVVHHFTTKKELNAFLDKSGLSSEVVHVEERRELEPLKNALYNVKHMIRTIMEKTDHSLADTVVYLSGSNNFRYERATLRPYKGNRDKAHRPTYEKAIREYMTRHYDTRVSDGQEADDEIGIAHRAIYDADPHGSIIATVDKDLDMVPGLHYNFVKDQLYNVSPNEAIYKFCRQLITGDSVDNVVGVPGYGEAKADKFLDVHVGDGFDFEEALDSIKTLYVQTYGSEIAGEEAMNECADLLWIRQYPKEGPWARL